MSEELSHAITVVEKFKMDGVLYDSPEKAISAREDMLGEFMDKTLVKEVEVLSPKMRIQLHDALIKHRQELRRLLDY